MEIFVLFHALNSYEFMIERCWLFSQVCVLIRSFSATSEKSRDRSALGTAWSDRPDEALRKPSLHLSELSPSVLTSPQGKGQRRWDRAPASSLHSRPAWQLQLKVGDVSWPQVFGLTSLAQTGVSRCAHPGKGRCYPTWSPNEIGYCAGKHKNK